MTTIHLGDCLNGCDVCADNYHADFSNIDCDTCGKFIEGAPICNNCGQYEVHAKDSDCPAFNDDSVFEFNLNEVVQHLSRDGIKATVEMTGGGCATIYCGDADAEGFYQVACGPAVWNWDNPSLSYGDVREFYIGRDGDMDDNYFIYTKGNNTRTIANVIFNYFMDGLKNTDTCKHCYRFPATKGDFCECCTYEEAN